MKIARRFIAGNRSDPPTRSPVGTAETSAVGQSSLRDSFTSPDEHPAINRRAIVDGPAGACYVSTTAYARIRHSGERRNPEVVCLDSGLRRSDDRDDAACAGVTIGTIPARATMAKNLELKDPVGDRRDVFIANRHLRGYKRESTRIRADAYIMFWLEWLVVCQRQTCGSGVDSEGAPNKAEDRSLTSLRKNRFSMAATRILDSATRVARTILLIFSQALTLAGREVIGNRRPLPDGRGSDHRDPTHRCAMDGAPCSDGRALIRGEFPLSRSGL